MKSVLVFACLLLPIAAQAASLPRGERLQRLFTVTNSGDERVGRISVSYDTEGKATGLFLGMNRGDELDGDAFRLHQIESAEGAVLLVERGYKALILKGKLDRETQEGRFRLHYLANGLSKKYESCDLKLRLSGTNWYIENAYTGRRVDRMHIRTWALGIRTLEGICPAEARD